VAPLASDWRGGFQGYFRRASGEVARQFMTLNRHGRPNFAVMHKTAFFNDVVGCSPRR
jgi:hypothetical protein